VKKIPKQEYTAEFKEQAVKHAQAVGIVVAARELGLVEQTLRNWVRAAEAGKLVRHADAYGQDDFGFAAYGKPAAVLHQLRGLLGDETFFAAFRRYTADWAYKHPYPHDFFHAFADASKQDLSAYFRTWFFEAWSLDSMSLARRSPTP